MAEENKVILHGTWASLFVKRVELALKIKGIAYEYVEEDLSNKSPQLLKYNPALKKVPVLVHNDKPVSESLVILEYIDETWKTGPRILPQDPYERAIIRFWANYFDQHLIASTGKLWKSTGEEQEKAQEEVLEKIRILEEGITEIHGNELGLLQILLVTTFGSHKAYEEVLGVTILVPENTPLLYSCVTSLNELPVVKEICTPHDMLVSKLKIYRQNALKSTTH
ncbi:PREDICTED: glutathione S-transferase U10-like [Nicotiana attenuata]|uniref:Glutathione S-transferase n=1 Tax=Nicotiana attenuata TaxID=49451 RepID=A0A1J6KB14_NICAT|nr:PREDICTED: glutathione S-transferase U10-like [Nicotiana attenuata]OIT22152.1 glutathione s-transferase u10 [Nicotiana attenuata]